VTGCRLPGDNGRLDRNSSAHAPSRNTPGAKSTSAATIGEGEAIMVSPKTGTVHKSHTKVSEQFGQIVCPVLLRDYTKATIRRPIAIQN
jgi:hypothetical protein